MTHSKGTRRQRKKKKTKKRLVSNALVCSLDLAKKRHTFQVRDKKDESLAEGTVPHTQEGLEDLLEKLESLREKRGHRRTVFFMEGASHFWMPLVSFLERRGYTCRLVQNRSVSHQRHVSGQSGWKTDPRDAAHIGELGVSLHFSFTELPTSEVWTRLRACGCEYQELTDQMTAEKNRIHAFLETVLPRYYEIFANPFRQSSLAVLATIPKAHQLPQEEFIRQVRQAFQGTNLRAKRARSVFDYVNSEDPWGYVEARPAICERIGTAAERLQLQIRQRKEVEDRLLDAYRRTGYSQNLDSIHGSSSVKNAVLLGIIGDPADFDTSGALVRMAGLDPGRKSSGQHQGRTEITKAGRPRLRRAATDATMVFLMSGGNKAFPQRYYYLQNREENPLTEVQALCACAAKYLRTAWWLCVCDDRYDPVIASEGFGCSRTAGEKQGGVVLHVKEQTAD